MTTDASAASHCPNCLTEYRAGFDSCSDCGVPLEPGPAPSAGVGTIEIVDAGPRDAADAADDLFAAEEYPSAVVLAALPEWQTLEVVDRLQRAGIGARVGRARPDGGFEVLVHDTHLLEAQAIVAEATGDVPASASPEWDVEPAVQEPEATDLNAWEDANRRAWGGVAALEVEPSKDEFALVTSAPVADAIPFAERLAAKGIDVRILRQPDDPADPPTKADLLVPQHHVSEARLILGIAM